MNINIVFYLFFSVLIIWEVSLAILYKRNFLSFVPFFVIGILFCLDAAFIFYEIDFLFFFIIVKIIGIVSLFFIFLEIRRIKNE